MPLRAAANTFKTKIPHNFLQVVSSELNNLFSSGQPPEHHKYLASPGSGSRPACSNELPLLEKCPVNPWDFIGRLRDYFRLSFGRLQGEWEHTLFPDSEPKLRRSLINWARFHLIGHALILTVSLYFGLWIIPIVVTLAPFYGGAIQFLCINAQHIGLQDNVDFHGCWTIQLNPFCALLNMNTIPNTTCSAVPLPPGKAYAAIKTDLPDSPRAAEHLERDHRHIEKQKEDPTYQYKAKLPRYE
jgi:hypothetical protein